MALAQSAAQHHPFAEPYRHRLRRVLLAVVAAVLALGPISSVGAAGNFVALADYPVPNGHFYSQASGQGNTFGFAIVDDGGTRLYDEFARLGGVDKLGYPSSQRFGLDGFTSQATQKEVLQWRPELGHVDFVNIFDVFTARGLDPTLAQTRLIPPTQDNSGDAHLPWSAVVSRHLALLDQDPAIRATYFADPNPIEDFGLPQGAQDFGEVFVIRCERAAFQHWRIAMAFAQPGDVTQVNGGDLAKQLGLVSSAAAVPSPAGTQLIAPPGVLLAPDASILSAARQSAAAALPSLVRVDVTFPSATGIASGIVLDAAGDVLTNEHVVDSAVTIKITYGSGIQLAGRVVGADIVDDLAVIRPASTAIGNGVKAATFISGGGLVVGQFVVALGDSPFFPVAPATRLGIYQKSIADTVSILSTDTFILPGDSGGMLLDLAGNVVGVNDEIRITDQSQQPLTGFSIDAGDALRIAQLLLRGAS